jgi:hypothetical protein
MFIHLREYVIHSRVIYSKTTPLQSMQAIHLIRHIIINLTINLCLSLILCD